MKHLFLVSLSIIVCILGNPAQAQPIVSQKFTGFAAGVSVGYTRNTVDYNEFLSNKESKKSTNVATLDLSYGIPVAPHFAVSVGATYDLNKPSFGSVTYKDGLNTEEVSVKLKNHFSLYVAPGYEILTNLQLYGKLSWHNAKGDYTDSGIGSGTTTHNGYGYGIGVAAKILDNLETKVELQQIRFSRESRNASSGKPQSNRVNLYLGYRF